jgi:membrane-associated HD superfamily phosphohydrolase
MLSQRAVEASSIFTRRDLSRLAIAAALLVAALSGIFALDLFPRPLEIQVGDVASADIVAPRTDGYVSKIQTQADKDAASTAVAPVYDYSSEKALRIAGVQLKAFEDRVKTVDTAFDPATKTDVRSALLEAALPGLTEDARVTLVGLKPDRWKAVRAEASRVLDATEIAELKDSSVDQVKVGLTGQMAGGLDEGERTLAAQMIAPLVVPNSSYSPELTAQAKVKAPDLVPDRMINSAQNETIVR